MATICEPTGLKNASCEVEIDNIEWRGMTVFARLRVTAKVGNPYRSEVGYVRGDLWYVQDTIAHLDLHLPNDDLPEFAVSAIISEHGEELINLLRSHVDDEAIEDKLLLSVGQ